jgi:AcrR family transcriptional regulator
VASGTATVRARVPDRKAAILTAAADLISRNGYHAVSMTDIGSTAGITGPAIYRHFGGKPAVLVALFDQVIDRLLAEAREIVRREDDAQAALLLLISDQVDFVVADRILAQVYYHEIHSLPAEDRRRLRRKQRLYVDEWVHLVQELRPTLSDTAVQTTVHAAIGAVQSSLFHRPGLADAGVRDLLTAAAVAVLDLRS